MPKIKIQIADSVMQQIGRNIQNYRLSNNLSQSQLAFLICEEAKLSEQLSTLAISAYESGRRCPPVPTLIVLANIFDITLDELIGNPTKKKKVYNNRKKEVSDEHNYLIKATDYALYDKKPVWMETDDENIEDCWGILDYKNHDSNVYFICTKGAVKINDKIRLYTQNNVDVIDIDGKSLCGLCIKTIKGKDVVYCISTSSDMHIKDLYTGYYKNDEKHMILINLSNGIALPYAGLGVSYQVFG